MPPASGSAEVAHGSAQNGFTAVLFDWRGTLFHDESDQDWIRASAASIGRTPSDDEVDHLAKRLGAAAEHPLVRTARERADCSVELHRAATLLQLRLAGSYALVLGGDAARPLARLGFTYPIVAAYVTCGRISAGNCTLSQSTGVASTC
jgi:hypothetical protein